MGAQSGLIADSFEEYDEVRGIVRENPLENDSSILYLRQEAADTNKI